jgi:putative endonuclease
LPQTSRQRVGKWGESAAARYLERQGYNILARNVRTAYGEIDLVARQAQGEFVFVEVKTRTGLGFGYPEEAVDARKMVHLISSAQAYMLGLVQHTEQLPQGEDHWRIDVIAVLGKPGDLDGAIRFEHFENIAT